MTTKCRRDYVQRTNMDRQRHTQTHVHTVRIIKKIDIAILNNNNNSVDLETTCAKTIRTAADTIELHYVPYNKFTYNT